MTEKTESTQTSSTKRLTRGISLLLIPFLTAAGCILYLWPGDTGRLFAWDISPEMTALLMGAGYLAGAHFFARTAETESWERVSAGFPPVAIFAWISAAYTLLHWNLFNHQHLTFYAWAGLYFLTPILVPRVIWANRSRPSRKTPDARHPLPSWVQNVWRGFGVVTAALAVALFVVPGTMDQIWPWSMTPLTGRVLASWFALAAGALLVLSFRSRPVEVQIPLETQLVGQFFILLGIARVWADLGPGIGRWLFVVGMGGLFFFNLLVYLRHIYPGGRR